MQCHARAFAERNPCLAFCGDTIPDRSAIQVPPRQLLALHRSMRFRMYANGVGALAVPEGSWEEAESDTECLGHQIPVQRGGNRPCTNLNKYITSIPAIGWCCPTTHKWAE